jgi:acetyltransferase-like isoleucine patch superfamily enzyme/acyl carrier protein
LIVSDDPPEIARADAGADHDAAAADVADFARSTGEPLVYNEGEIHFGSCVAIATLDEPVTLVTRPGGLISLGDDVAVGAGTTIAAFGRVEVGAETRIGARCRLLDDASKAGIRIGDHVQIEDDVMVVSGAVIGAGARILRGALVSGRVQPGGVVKRTVARLGADAPAAPASAAATPAVQADVGGDEPALLHDVRATVSHILPSAKAAEANAPLSDWDSLTTVHLIVALEDRFGITIDDGALIDRRTLQALADYVEEQRTAMTGQTPPRPRRITKPTVVALSDDPAADETPARVTPPEGIVLPPMRRSEGISMEIRALGGAFSRPNLLVKLANLLPIWSLRHLRSRLLRGAGCRIAHKCTFLGRVHFIGASPANLEVGEGAIIGPNITLGVDGKITLGRNVSISPGVTIYTGTHDVGPAHRRMDPRVLAKAVAIEDGVWIGMNALILPGVRIGAGAIVSAGAVVSSDVPSNTVVAGNPAVVVRTVVA